MRRMQKALALVLSLVMLIALSAAAMADLTGAEYAAQAQIVPTSYEGKTVIIHSNDVHGAVMGYAYIPALRAQLESLGAEVITVDVGDFSQGTIYVSTSKGASAVDFMNEAGYDLVTLGNHEFDYGYAQLMENLAKANFTTICADVYDDETNETILPATAVVETASGLKIGFFGMETPETATKVNPGLISNISFATFDNLYKSAQTAVDSLGEVDLVVCLAHLGVDTESKANGYRSIDLYNNVNGIDFIIDGHSHTQMTAGADGEPIQSTGTKFANIGIVVIDNETKAVERNFLVATDGLEMDEAVAAKIQAVVDAVDEEYGETFAATEVTLNGERNPGNRTEETNLGDLITDAMVWSVVKEGGIAQDELNNVIGITNGGGIRATVEAGDITRKDINTVLPFGNTVAVVYVTGEQLLEALEASTFCTPEEIGGFPQTSGIEWNIDTTVEFDQGDVYVLNGKESSYYAPASIKRVTITKVNGEDFDPAKVYAVVTNNFCAAGGDTYNVFSKANDAGSGFDTGIPLDEAVIDYIGEVLDGKITAEAYGEPRGTATQTR